MFVIDTKLWDKFLLDCIYLVFEIMTSMSTSLYKRICTDLGERAPVLLNSQCASSFGDGKIETKAGDLWLNDGMKAKFCVHSFK